jgi:hypothetical protein
LASQEEERYVSLLIQSFSFNIIFLETESVGGETEDDDDDEFEDEQPEDPEDEDSDDDDEEDD